MIASLDDDQGVPPSILGRDEPRCMRPATPAADPEALALPDREEGKSPMLADAGPVLGLDGSGCVVDEPGEKRRKPAFSDEAQPGAASFVVRRQTCATGHVAHRRLAQLPEGKDGSIELRLIERMEEVALILVPVGSLQQAHSAVRTLDSGVVAGCNTLGTEPLRMFEEGTELHLTVARHVRVGSHSVLEVANELHEDAVPVRVGAVHGVQRDAERVANVLRVGEILGRRAVTVPIVLFPVLHEHRLHRDARLDQPQQCDGGVDPTRDCDHRRLGGIEGCRVHPETRSGWRRRRF